jgi:hypothetical protein
VFTQLFQPALHIVESDAFGDVVHEEGTDGPPVVGACDCAIPFLKEGEEGGRVGGREGGVSTF